MEPFIRFWTLSTTCSFGLPRIFPSRELHRLQERVRLNHCWCPLRFPKSQVLVLMEGSFWLLSCARFECDFINNKSYLYSSSCLRIYSDHIRRPPFTLHTLQRVPISYVFFSPLIPYILNTSHVPQCGLGKNRGDKSSRGAYSPVRCRSALWNELAWWWTQVHLESRARVHGPVGNESV